MLIFLGTDVTIVSHSKALGVSIQAAEELKSIGVDAEVCCISNY